MIKENQQKLCEIVRSMGVSSEGATANMARFAAHVATVKGLGKASESCTGTEQGKAEKMYSFLAIGQTLNDDLTNIKYAIYSMSQNDRHFNNMMRDCKIQTIKYPPTYRRILQIRKDVLSMGKGKGFFRRGLRALDRGYSWAHFIKMEMLTVESSSCIMD